MRFLILFVVIFGAASASTKVEFSQLEEFLQHLSASSSTKFDVTQLEEFLRHISQHENRRPIETINDFADMLIEEYRHFLKQFGLDPLPLPDLSLEIPPAGSFNLSDGLANDLSELYRDGDVIIEYENRIYQANFTLFFKKISMNYNYNVNVSNIEVGGKVVASVIYLPITVSLKIDFIKYHVSLEQFQIPEIGNIKIDFEDGIADWLLKILSGMMSQTFEDFIIGFAHGQLKDSLESFIEVINKVLDFIFNQ